MKNFRCISIQRIIFKVCLLIALFIGIHIVQTTSFLIQHFTQDGNRNPMIKLDMNIWYDLMNNQSRRKIPRHIHQIWISSKNDKEMYDSFRKAANACIELHPNYIYNLWTNKDSLILLKTHYSWFLSTYENYQYDIQRIDAMKYIVLYHFGGIYIDLDVKCKVQDLITSMLPLNKRDIEPDIIFHMGTEGVAANTDIMAAKKYHPFFKLAVSQLKAANRWFYLYHFTVILSAGPTYLYGIYHQFPLKDVFYYVPNSLLYGTLIEGVGGGTWYGKDTRLMMHFVENKLWTSLVIFISIASLFYVRRLFQKKILI